MPSITIDGLDTVVADLQGVIVRKPQAIVRALNRAIGSARTVMVREIARDIGLKSAAVRDALPVRLATANQPSATLAASLTRIPLIQFNARGPEPSRGKGRGVSYKLQGGRNQLPHAFIATMGSGHRGVFARSETKFMRYQKPTWKKKRQAIQELFGPSLGHVFAKYHPLGLARAQEAFLTNFDHEMAFATADRFAETRSQIGMDV